MTVKLYGTSQCAYYGIHTHTMINSPFLLSFADAQGNVPNKRTMPLNWRYVWALLKKHQIRIFMSGTNKVKPVYHKAFVHLTKRCAVTFQYGKPYWSKYKAGSSQQPKKTHRNAEETEDTTSYVNHFRPPPQYVLDMLETTGQQLSKQAYFMGSMSAGETHVLSAWV